MEELKTINRRSFLKKTGSLIAAAGLSNSVFSSLAQAKSDVYKLTILHTNDVHSRIEPFPMDGSRNQGLAGAARRATLIDQIRSTEKNVLLLDAGDTVQGTPYFNLFNGDLEMKLMNAMGYDASTFGNHEFDNGVEKLADMIQKAKFPFLNANYDLTGTALEGLVNPYKIFNKQGIRIGVFGLGINLENLVDPVLCKGVTYQDPLPIAIRTADMLKMKMNCSLVICLSHLGYRYRDQQISDTLLAANSRNIDVIIGGHTHTFLPQAEHITNIIGQTTIVNQVGFGGINLGRIDFEFEKRSGKRKFISSENQKVQ